MAVFEFHVFAKGVYKTICLRFVDLLMTFTLPFWRFCWPAGLPAGQRACQPAGQPADQPSASSRLASGRPAETYGTCDFCSLKVFV